MFADIFKIFFVFYRANIVHAAQFVELPQGKTRLSQIFGSDLAVVLRQILVGLGDSIPEFTQYHTGIYAAGGVGAGGVADPGNTPPGAPAPGAAPAPPGTPGSPSPAMS